jgi:hypothetical protein
LVKIVYEAKRSGDLFRLKRCESLLHELEEVSKRLGNSNCDLAQEQRIIGEIRATLKDLSSAPPPVMPAVEILVQSGPTSSSKADPPAVN